MLGGLRQEGIETISNARCAIKRRNDDGYRWGFDGILRLLTSIVRKIQCNLPWYRHGEAFQKFWVSSQLHPLMLWQAYRRRGRLVWRRISGSVAFLMPAAAQKILREREEAF